ncbi:MAG: hypothetical protein KatS3mg131_3012 [Candidatus Tectimicrobiota bacterium]|nr:MAG: hypothetical protein KatS3mg131_3012 [Candidatus Tectomicrobia bacterium]
MPAFAHPQVLWGLLLLFPLACLLWRASCRRRRLLRQWSAVPEVHCRSRLPSGWREWQSGLSLLAGFVLAVLGFASPMWHRVQWEPAWERVALGLLLDVSRSMDAPALPHAPELGSRLAVMKQAVQELLARLPPGVRIGVVAFAGVAVPLVPEPSADHQAVLAKVRRLDTDFIAHPGTDLAAALREGLALFVDDEAAAAKALVLLSDGDAAPTPALQAVLDTVSVPIFVLGLGTPQPVALPAASGSWPPRQRYASVTTRLNEPLLRLVAARSGGTYYPMRQQAHLTDVLRRLVAQQGMQVAKPVPRPRSVRHWLFLAASACLFAHLWPQRPRWRGPR